MTSDADRQRLPPWLREWIALALMCAAVAAVYWWPRFPGGTGALAGDYNMLHVDRMQFARDALFGPRHALPAWYPGQLLGTPFWANIQNFPFLPTRLLILLTDPSGPYTYTLAVTLGAALAAIFTYLFARRIGIGVVGSATAGWTFACCGFFAARVAAQHLPLLEVFGGLPLLLWCVESLVRSRESGGAGMRWIIALAVSSMCLMLAGHPQLPVYAIATAVAYLFCRAAIRSVAVPLAAIVLGAGCASFALVPMALLVGRSTRIMSLSRAENDLSMPYGRLLGFFFPWRDGVPFPMPGSETNLFHGYPSLSYFWDTFCYAGWAPWIATGMLLVLCLAGRSTIRIGRIGAFIVAMGLGGIVLSLPLLHQITSHIPGTFLRSPARLIYLTEFALALSLGTAVHVLLSGSFGVWSRWVVIVGLLWHTIDLGRVGRSFLFHVVQNESDVAPVLGPLLPQYGQGRISVDHGLKFQARRLHEDIGFYDSVALSRPYNLLLDLSNAPMDTNLQAINGSELAVRTLQTTGVTLLLTTNERPELTALDQIGALKVYPIPNPASRMRFFSRHEIIFVPDSDLRPNIRIGGADLGALLLLPQSVYPKSVPVDVSNEPARMDYTRINSDRIDCTVTTGHFGYLRLIESWDPGWSATINGEPAPVVPALGALLAVAVPPGHHQVSFVYRTPGATIGIVLSLGNLSLLVVLLWFVRRRAGAEVGFPGPVAHNQTPC